MSAGEVSADGGAPLRVVFPFLGERIGGSHISAFTLADALRRGGQAAPVVLARRGSAILAEAERLGLETAAHEEPATARNGPHVDLLRFPRRMLALRQLGADVVHANDVGTLQAFAVPARLAGARVIYHHRSLNRPVLPNRIVVGLAHHVIAISDAAAENLAFVPRARLTKVMNPFAIEVGESRDAAREWLRATFHLPDDARVFGFIGNLWERKRPVFFLEAAAEIVRREPRARFVMFGRDGDVSSAKVAAEAARLGVTERVTLAGFHLPVARNVAALDVLLLPAIREPLGRTPIEAILLGTPYAATADAGHLEIHGRWGGGLLVPLEATPEAFATAALDALRDATLAWPEARRSEIADEVSPAAHATQVLRVYRAVRGEPLPSA